MPVRVAVAGEAVHSGDCDDSDAAWLRDVQAHIAQMDRRDPQAAVLAASVLYDVPLEARGLVGGFQLLANGLDKLAEQQRSTGGTTAEPQQQT